MKVSQYGLNTSLWWKFILLWKFIIAIECSSSGWNLSIYEYLKLWLYKYFWWKFHHCDENSSNIEKSTL